MKLFSTIIALTVLVVSSVFAGPPFDGNAPSVQITAGVISRTAIGAAGAEGQISYNCSGIYCAQANFNIVSGTGNVGIGTTNPSTTLHVSGTVIAGKCAVNVVCGVNQSGALCYRATNSTYYYCDGANSWTPMTVSTKVSASALN